MTRSGGRTRGLLAALVVAVAVALAACGQDEPAADAASASVPAVRAADARGGTVLRGRVTGIDGRQVDLDRFRGDVVLVVNTASRCGNTPQFEGLESLYRANRAAGLVVLGFPSDDFRQELGSNGAVARFCRLNYGVTFPMFARSKVTGSGANPLFRRLNAATEAPDWNFSKYLVDRQGRVAARFDASVPPDDPRVTAAVAALLVEPAPA